MPKHYHCKEQLIFLSEYLSNHFFFSTRPLMWTIHDEMALVNPVSFFLFDFLPSTALSHIGNKQPKENQNPSTLA